MKSFVISLLCIGFFHVDVLKGNVNEELLKQCRYSDAWQNEYNDFFKITDLPGVRVKEYIDNFPFFLRASRDAHVLLTSGPRAVRSDNEYEIVIGGWGGSKSVIRRQQQSQEPLATAEHPVIISGKEWNAYLLQVSKSGDIKLFRKEENGTYNLIIQAHDSEPIPIEYISFGSWDNNHVELYFNCPPNLIKPDVNQNLPTGNCANIECREQCRYSDAWQNEYNDFFKIADVRGARPKGYKASFPFFVRAHRDVHVLFTTGPISNRDEAEYEIVIGGWGGTQTVIRRKQQSQQPLASAHHPSPVISSRNFTEFLLQITEGGEIKLFRVEGTNSHSLVVGSHDFRPIPVEYISFGSWENNHVEFYFNCSFSPIAPNLNVMKKPANDIRKMIITYPVDNPGACHVSEVPENGWIEYIFETKERISRGDFINPFTTVNYKCLPNNIIEGATRNFCLNGVWKDPVPKCQPRCSTKVITGVTITPSRCTLNNVEVSCFEPAKPGTIALIECRDRYERQSFSKQQVISCGDDGLWSPTPDVCSPICGEEAAKGTPYVVGGFNASINEVPWHAGIYKRNQGGYGLHCGGTILSARIVVSAMHCFWDPKQDKKYDESLFRVGVGKEKLEFDAIENQKEQKFGVETIHYDPGYSHATGNFAADIVLIVLNSAIDFKAYIAPICFPYGLKFGDKAVPVGWVGRVAGWGKTSTGGAPSEFLKVVNLPTIDRAQCFTEPEVGFRPYITPDKFCAGHLNANISVCEGDSGGGLVFQSMENGRIKWYLRGIVSTGANRLGSCDSDKYTTFTNVAYYESLITSYEPLYRPR